MFMLVGVLAIVHVNLFAQSRLYLSAGVAGNAGGPFYCCKDYQQLFGHPVVDLEADTKIVGALHFLTGISYYQVRFSSDDRFFGSAIEYQGHYLAVPLMARLNYRNRNFLYGDFGVNPYYILHADLKESIYQWDGAKTVEGTISPYMNRLNISLKVQGTLAFNRILASVFFIQPFGGQPLSKDLNEHWGLNKQQSTFLQNDDVQGFVFGFKAGYRLR
jgi:hypothetical protein